MAGYLDEYGVADARREKTIKYVAISVLVAVIAGAGAFYFFRNRAEAGVAEQFISALRSKNYSEAYAMWGCTPQTPCKYYAMDRFLEDWSAMGPYKNPAEIKIAHVDACDTGVVFDLSYPGTDDQGLWVERSTKILSFAPWARCPGPHLQIGEFIKSHFGGSH